LNPAPKEGNAHGILVQEMVPDGIETILGARRDPQFGPVLLFGHGGIYTEVWKDAAFRVAPLSLEDARQMIDETRLSRILQGVRGQKPCNVDLLCQCLLRLSQLMMDLPAIREIDINPFKIGEKEGKAVDVRIFLDRNQPSRG
jgi:acetyltransferase